MRILLTVGLLSLAAISVCSCDVVMYRKLELDSGVRPGWIVLEYDSARCPAPGVGHETIRVPPSGFACTAAHLQVAEVWTCELVDGTRRKTLTLDAECRPGTTMIVDERKFELIEYTPGGRRATESPGEAVRRYIKQNP